MKAIFCPWKVLEFYLSEDVGTMVSEYDKEKKLEKRRANYKKQLSEVLKKARKACKKESEL